jgi:transaldolase
VIIEAYMKEVDTYIDREIVINELMNEGLEAFKVAFSEIMNSLS